MVLIVSKVFVAINLPGLGDLEGFSAENFPAITLQRGV